MDEEILLEGGNTHATIVRVGDTVRRPTGPWTPGVHALLRHLESRGFEGAPRVLGRDDEAREILTYVSGEVVWPDRFELVDDRALAEIARCVRAFHDAGAGFAADGFAWSEHGRDPSCWAEVMCHNDLAPWNLVRADGRWVFIDWDGAAPGRRSWDLGWALLSLVPFWEWGGLDDERVARRTSIFADAYGRDLVSRDVVAVARERSEHEARLIRERGTAGAPPYDRLLAEGHADVWAAGAAHIARREDDWTRRAFG